MKDEEKSVGSCLWVLFIWGSPVVVVPLLVAMSLEAWPLGVVLALGFLFWMGRLQAAGSNASPDDKASHWVKVVLYMVAQIILVPLVLCGVFWGACLLMGAGHSNEAGFGGLSHNMLS